MQNINSIHLLNRELHNKTSGPLSEINHLLVGTSPKTPKPKGQKYILPPNTIRCIKLGTLNKCVTLKGCYCRVDHYILHPHTSLIDSITQNLRFKVTFLYALVKIVLQCGIETNDIDIASKLNQGFGGFF